VHRGRHAASGVLLDPRIAGAETARRRVLALWEPGVRVNVIDGALLVRFPHPRPLDAASAPGHLVLDEDGVLVGAPLSPAERGALAPGRGTLVVAQGGCARALGPGAEIDPASWLELAQVVVAVEPLGAPPPLPDPPPPPPAADVRRALAIAPAAAEAARAAVAIRRALAGTTSREAGPVGRVAGAMARGLAGSLRRLGVALRTEWSYVQLTATAPRTVSRVAGPPAPPGPLAIALRRLAGRVALLTGLARVAGFRQGLYLARLLRMLDHGDLGEALRHAIPLDRAGSAGAPALGIPRPRATLEIGSGGPGPGTMGLGPALFGELERRYRAMVELLTAQRRHDEAAFVLAELLRADAEAVSYLERHGRLRLAAELAEARGLPAGLAVRQWFLAGDVEQAIRVARARHAFADAVHRLSTTGRVREAAALRVCWAEDLAAAGDLEGAVHAIRDVEGADALAERWIACAVDAGGPAGHALLPTWLELAPGRFGDVRDRFLAACADPSADGPVLRAALARGLASSAATDATRALARPVLRAVLRDRAAGVASGGVDLGRLTTLASDGALEADLPATPREAPARPSPVALTVHAGDRGTRPAPDAAVLPGGRVLVALGEAGALLLARDGRTVARFDVPAHALVVSDSGTRALAVAPRGEAVRVSRLDLDRRTATPIRDLRISRHARTFDGSIWFVTTADAILALDALRDDLRTLWHVEALPGRPLAPCRDPRHLTFVTVDSDGGHVGWSYELPSLTLRRREALEAWREGEQLLGVGGFAAGRWFSVVSPDGDAAPLLRSAMRGSRGAFLLPGVEEVVALEGDGDHVAVGLRIATGVTVAVVEPEELSAAAIVTLEGAGRAALRVVGAHVTVADSAGRVIGIDAARGAVSHDLRL
jgi:hypothetical protein